MKKLFNLQERLHNKSKHHETKPMHPSSLRAFQRHQEYNLKHPGSVDLTSTKQTTFLRRWMGVKMRASWTCLYSKFCIGWDLLQRASPNLRVISVAWGHKPKYNGSSHTQHQVVKGGGWRLNSKKITLEC